MLLKHKNYKKYSEEKSNADVVKETKGAWSTPQEEEKIKKNHEEYIKKQHTLNVNKINRYRKNERSLTKNIEDLKKIADVCKKHNIKLIVAINPHNYNMMNRFDLDAYYRYLYEISKITNYWNFSGYNIVTLDNHHYYEESHFRPYIAERMMKRIFTITQEDKEFGQYITSENIDTVLKQIKKEVNNYENSLNNKN